MVKGWFIQSRVDTVELFPDDADEDSIGVVHFGFWFPDGSNTPQAPDKFNPKVNLQTYGIIQMLYETKQIETITFGKSVIALFSKIEPKMSK